MNTLTSSILLLLFSSASSHVFHYALIKDYLQWNNIKAVLLLTCDRSDWTEPKIIENLKIDDIFMGFWDMAKETNLSNFDYQHFFLRSSYPFCVVVNWECNQTYNMLSEISKRTMFHYERYWLMFGRSADEMFKVLSGEYINVDAEVAMVAPSISDNEYGIDEIYNPSVKRHGLFRKGSIGTWNVISGLQMNEMESKFDRRNNLGGITFFSAIAIPKLPPNKTFIEHIDADEYLYMDNLSKSDYRVFQILEKMFNFKMAVIRVRRWGGVTPNGTWMGLVGVLNRSEVDLSITGIRWDSDRYGVLDQTTESFYVQIVFIFRHPRIVDAAGLFLTPFYLSVWLLIVALGSITSLLIRQSFLLENILHVNESIKANESSYDNSFLMIFGALIQQGYAGDPVFISSRISFLTISMFSIMMFQFYGSFILGSLLTEAPKTIKTMKQLLKTDLDFAMDEIPYIQDAFYHIREESAVEMYNKIMAQPKPILPLFTGLDLVKKGTMAFNTDGIYAYAVLKTLLTDNELCDLQEVKYVDKIPTGPGLPKKSPLRELIKIGIRKIRETGVLAHIWKTWIARIAECERSDVDVVPVDVIHFSSALYVLGFGIQISCLIFLCELFFVYCCRQIIDIFNSK